MRTILPALLIKTYYILTNFFDTFYSPSFTFFIFISLSHHFRHFSHFFSTFHFTSSIFYIISTDICDNWVITVISQLICLDSLFMLMKVQISHQTHHPHHSQTKINPLDDFLRIIVKKLKLKITLRLTSLSLENFYLQVLKQIKKVYKLEKLF